MRDSLVSCLGCENLVKPNRTFVMEGAVTLVTVDETTSSSNVLSPRVAPAKVKEKDKPLQNAPCRLFHFSDLLLVTLPEKAAKKSGKSSSSTPEFKALESFALESVRVVPDSADARVFQIVNPKQTFVFQASTTTDKESWVNSLLLHIEMASRYKRTLVAPTAVQHDGSGATRTHLAHSFLAPRSVWRSAEEDSVVGEATIRRSVDSRGVYRAHS